MRIVSILLLAVAVSVGWGQDDPKPFIDQWVAEQSKDPGAPHPSRLYFLKATEATLRGFTAAAAYAYDKALELDPNFGAAANNKGFAYLRANDPDRAAEVLSKYAERFPNNPTLLHNLGTARFMQKKYDEAIGWYDKASEKAFSPEESANALFGKGTSLVHLKKYDDALKALTAAVSLDPLHDGARQAMIRIQAYLWRKSPPNIPAATLLEEYRRRLQGLRMDADDLAIKQRAAIDRYLAGVDRILAKSNRMNARIAEMFSNLKQGKEIPQDPYDPGCHDAPLGKDEDRCEFRQDREAIEIVVDDLTAWSFCFGSFIVPALGFALSSSDWAEHRAKYREKLLEAYVTQFEKWSKQLSEIIALTEKPENLDKVAEALNGVALMARIILMHKRWMTISLPMVQRAFDATRSLAAQFDSEERQWIGPAHDLHRMWHRGRVGNEYALKQLCRANDAVCAKNHRKLEVLHQHLQQQAGEHLRKYRAAFAHDVEQIDEWYIASRKLTGNYKSIYEENQLVGGSVENFGMLGGFFDMHMWGTIGNVMLAWKVDCYVCSHACGHKNYHKIRYLPFDITFSLCGTYSFKIGGGGEFEVKMAAGGYGAYASVFFNPATLDYGARLGMEYRGVLNSIRNPLNPDYGFYQNTGRLPVYGQTLPMSGSPVEYMKPGQTYWMPTKNYYGDAFKKVTAEKPQPKWSCGISISAVPSVYVEFHASPEGKEVAIKGKIKVQGQREMFGGGAGVGLSESSPDVTIWQLWASPKQ